MTPKGRFNLDTVAAATTQYDREPISFGLSPAAPPIVTIVPVGGTAPRRAGMTLDVAVVVALVWFKRPTESMVGA